MSDTWQDGYEAGQDEAIVALEVNRERQEPDKALAVCRAERAVIEAAEAFVYIELPTRTKQYAAYRILVAAVEALKEARDE